MDLWVPPAEKPSAGGRTPSLCTHGDVLGSRLCISVSNTFWFRAVFLLRFEWNRPHNLQTAAFVLKCVGVPFFSIGCDSPGVEGF